MDRPAYSLRHHFTALLLTLPFISMSTIGGNDVTDLYKATALAAVLVALFYYLFLYKYDVMLKVALVFSAAYLALYFSYLIMAVGVGCSLFQSCDLFGYIFYEPYKIITTWGMASVFTFFDLGLILAYWNAGTKLGLRDE